MYAFLESNKSVFKSLTNAEAGVFGNLSTVILVQFSPPSFVDCIRPSSVPIYIMLESNFDSEMDVIVL